MSKTKQIAPAEFSGSVHISSEGSLNVTGSTVLGGRLTRLNPETIFRWNYITCGYPIVTNLGNASDGVMATEDKFGMLFPGPNNEWFPAACLSVGAFTAAGKPPQVDGTVPATDTATTVAGLDLQMDCETGGADIGLEIVLAGGPLGGNANGFTVGTHSGYIDATFHTADWTDFDCVAIGFRKVQDFDDGHVPILKTSAAGDGIYTDFAALGALGDTVLETATDLNNSGTSVSTSTGEVPVDNQNLRVRITLSSAGVVTYGFVVNAAAGAGTLAEPGTVAAFTFDDGDVLVPYIATLSDTANADVLSLKDITVSRTPGISYQN